MSAHTKGPWHLVMSDNATPFIMHESGSDWTDISDLSSLVCHMPAEISRNFNSLENARRIVACVNACAGLHTEHLEKFCGTTFGHFKEVKNQVEVAWGELAEIRADIKANPEESTADEVRRVVAQRDELLAALDCIAVDLQQTADGENITDPRAACRNNALLIKRLVAAGSVKAESH